MIKAVLVGIEHYPDASASWDLDGPANDVLRVLTYIVSRGVPPQAIQCLISALPRNIAVVDRIRSIVGDVIVPTETALNHLFEDTLPKEAVDPLLLYWSGHGFMEQDGQRRLFTSDARPELKKNINLNSLFKAIDSTTYRGIKRVDAIIDTCANYVAATTAGITDRNFPVGERDARGEQRILCAASAGQYARNLSAERTGLFTRELMAIAEGSTPADGDLFDFHAILPMLRERLTELHGEGAGQAPTLIWSRMDGVEETAPPPAADDGDLFLSRLGVFEGSFSFLGCKAVYPRSRTLEVDAQVRRLSTNGLLQPHDTFPRRYCLTAEARSSAKERLAVLGETDETLDKHARFYADLARTHELSLRSAARRGSIDMLEQELSNLLAALDRCEAHRSLAECGLEMAASLFWFWNLTGKFELGAERLRALLDAAEDAPKDLRARAHYAAGALAFMQGEYEKAEDLLGRSAQYWIAQPSAEARDGRLAYTLVVLSRAESDVPAAIRDVQQALELFRSRSDRWGEALALNDFGYALTREGRWDEAFKELNKSLSLWRALGDAWGTPLTLNNLGMVQLRLDQAVGARESHEEALAIQLEEGDAWGAAESLKYLGEVALATEDFAEARDCYRASLFRLESAPRPQIQLDCLFGLARLAAEAKPLTKRDAAPAARALGTWHSEIRKGELVVLPHHAVLAKALETRLRNVLDDSYSSHWGRGKAMSLSAALAALSPP